MTRNEFIEKAKLKHGNKYDYSLVEYVNSATKVKITCSIHGVFEQKPSYHLGGSGCQKCGGNFMDIEYFKEKANKKHDKKYDYSKVEYVNNLTKVCIICPKHGEFWQTPYDHLGGCGCRICANKVIPTTNEFIDKAKIIHGDKYDYSNVVYIKNQSKINIICPEHGEFYQRPLNHLNGQGCPVCFGNHKLNVDEFIKRSFMIHNNKYNYSKVVYVNVDTKVCIICPEHGEFWQTPYAHANLGSKCPKCLGFNKTTDEFINESKLIHGYKYDYSKVNYIDSITKISIICPIHGEFKQTPKQHLRGCGCPTCSESKGEKSISQILSNYTIEFKREYIFNDCKYKLPLPFDFYLPNYNVCIEYDGIQHFESVKYFGGIKRFNELKIKDNIKTKYCLDNNIKLIRIPHTEFKNIEKILKQELEL
jgi:hypothetical protein